MGQQSDTQEDAEQHLFKKGRLFMKRIKNITAIILVCALMLSTLMPTSAATPTSGKKQAHKVSDELLEVMGITYDELNADKFVDDGTTYSCIIWINDIDKEVAVRAGIDAAEKTRDTYRASAQYDYPYTIEEVNGTKYVEVQLADNENDEYVQTYIETERDAAAKLYETSNGNFVAENFKTRDTEVNYISSYTPCVFADLTISRIADLMNVESINSIGYWDNSHKGSLFATDVDSFTRTELTTLNSHIIGIAANTTKLQYNVSGSGVKIGQYDMGCPDDGSVNKRLHYTDTNNHATNVYTIMKKVASGATYYATGEGEGTIAEFKSGIEWLLTQGVNIINVSYGWYATNHFDEYDEWERWVDHIAYNHNVHIVQAAGNAGTAGIAKPAMAYNVITVGNVKKEGTAYVHEDSSSFCQYSPNRLFGRTYKPDICAPGSYEPGNDSATSYSTPLVTGTIALMCEYKPALKTKPRTVKAILAASTGENTGRYITADHDNFKLYGAGVINAMNAFTILDSNAYASSYVSSGTTERTYNITSGMNGAIRVALAYENPISISGTHSAENVSNMRLIGEVKVEVISPSNTIVTSCTVPGANLKVLEFYPTSMGTYKIKITMTQSNNSNLSTYIGVAWQW